MPQRIAAQLRRHIDILIMVGGSIATVCMLWQSNLDAVAEVQADVSVLNLKVESIDQVKTDVAVIKQQVEDMHDYILPRKKK